MLRKGLTMSKAKPVKQKKENKFLNGLKYFFKTLFSNNACIDGREHKWYFPVIVAVLSAVIATIPTMVSRFTADASTFFSSGYTYDYENALTKFVEETKDVKMEINGNVLELDQTAFAGVSKDPNGESKDYWGYYYKVPVNIATKPEQADSSSTDSTQDTTSSALTAEITTSKDVWYCGLAVYYSGDENPYTFAQTKMANVNYDPNYQLGHTELTKYSTNIIVIGKNAMYFGKGISGTSAKSAIQINYDSSSFQGKDLHAIVAKGENDDVLTPWKNLLNNGYSSTKVTLGWQYTAIMFAICVGALLLMGLLVWIMTRGKNNPFKFYTFWECQKIAYYAASAPAILSLLGFIPMFSSMTMFLFPMILILRITWMSMRSLRPQQ